MKIFLNPISMPPAPEYKLKVFITFFYNFANLQVYMIYNLINYSLEQKLYDYTINQIDENLLEIILNDNKYLIYHSKIQGPVNKRPPAERRIQLNPKLKETLHSYMGEDYKILLLGYDKTTNTFSFWNYGYNINIRSTQSLPTRVQPFN